MALYSKETLSIEDLFTLGHFAEAYKLGEDEILLKLADRALPRSLLLPRVPVPNSHPSPTQNNTHTSTSTGNIAAKSDRSANYGLATSAPASSSATTLGHNTSPLGASLSKIATAASSTTHEVRYAQSSGVASSSGNLPPCKPKDISFSTLPAPDQAKLRTLVTEVLPSLVIMVQCLFELNQKAQIVPFVQNLCGKRYEEYPFELAYLVINLFVTTKDYNSARVACEPMLSNLRSRLGPLPLMSDFEHNFLTSSTDSTRSLSASQPETPPKSRNQKTSTDSPSDDSGSPKGLGDILPPIAEEDEVTQLLRANFQSLMHLYIFYILCPLDLFADAKAFLFVEGRLHPAVVQEWICRVDEVEGASLEEKKRDEEAKRHSRNTASSYELPSNGSSKQPQDVNTPTSLKKASSWLWTLFDGEEAQDLPTVHAPLNQELQLSPTSKSSLALQTYGKLVKIYNFIASRYAELSPTFQLALAALATLAVYFTYLYASKLYRNSSIYSWIMERVQSVRAALTGRYTNPPAPRQLVAPPRFPSPAFQNMPASSRVVLGSGMLRPSNR